MPETHRQLSSISEIAHLVNASSDLGSMLDRICFGICRYTHWDMCSIMSVDEENGHSVLMARFDPFLVDDINAPRKWELQSSPASAVIATGEPVILLDAQARHSYPHYRADALTRKYHTAVILPLPARDMYARKMVIAVQSKALVEVGEESLEFLRTVSHLAAIAVGKAHRLLEEQQFNERMRKTSEAAGELMKLVLSDAAPEPVVHAIESLMGCPVIVLDHSARATIVGRAPDDVDEEVWLAAVHRHFHHQLLPRDTANGNSGAIEAPGFEAPFETHAHALTVDGREVGSIHFVRNNLPVAQVEDLLIQSVCFAASVLLMRSVISFKATTESQAKILQELVSGYADGDDFRARALKAGVDIRTEAFLVLISSSESFKHSDALLEFHRAVSFSLSSAFPGAVCVVREANSLLAWIPHGNPYSETQFHLVTIASELTRILGAAPLIARSGTCSSGEDYMQAWQTCERTMKLAFRFHRTGVLSEEAFGAHALVLASMPEKDIAVFVERTLSALEKADAHGGANLLDTVETFLRTGCKLQRSADVLSVHVTTLRYRLDRVRELCKLDFDDPEVRFGLELAFRFRKAGSDPSNGVTSRLS